MYREGKDISREKLQADIDEFTTKGKINKSTLTLDWMDNYVAKFHPEDIEKYIKSCAKIPNLKKKNDKGEVVDVKTVREKFVKEYFKEFTDEAIEEKKKEKKAEKEAKKAEKERLKTLSVEEQLTYRMNRLKEK